MNKIKILTTLFFSMGLSGCVSYAGNPSKYNNNELDKVNYEYELIKGMGIGSSGTTTPISKNYSLTTRNVAETSGTDIEASDNLCGIALIKQDNSKKIIPTLAEAKPNEFVKTLGFDYYTAKLKESTGITKDSVFNKNYTNDSENCQVFLSTAGTDTGMIGGPVYNNKNQLVGIMIQTTDKLYLDNKDAPEVHTKTAWGEDIVEKEQYKLFDWSKAHKYKKVSYSVFVPTQSFYNWLDNHMRYESQPEKIKFE